MSVDHGGVEYVGIKSARENTSHDDAVVIQTLQQLLDIRLFAHHLQTKFHHNERK